MEDIRLILSDLNNTDKDIRTSAKKQLQDLTHTLHGLAMKIDGPIRYDEFTRDKARSKLEELRVGISDLNVVYDAIRRPCEDDSDRYFNTRHYLFRLLAHFHDSRTSEFISSIYPELPRNDNIQFWALRVLSEINTETSLRTFVQLLVKHNADVQHNAYALFVPLYKHTENIKSMFPEILQVLDNMEYRDSVYLLLTCARNNGDIASYDFTGQILIRARKRLIDDLKSEEKMRRKLSAKSDKLKQSSRLIGTMLDFLGSFRDDVEVTSLTSQFLNDSDSDVALNAVIALLRQETTVDTAIMVRLAKDSTTRVRLYKELRLQRREHLFPNEYHSQAHFAESIMVNWLMPGMELGKPPDRIHLLATREVVYSGSAVRIHIFKFTNEDKSGVWMVGQSGPQPLDQSKVGTDGELTFSNFEKLDEKTIDEHVDSILEYLESISE